MCKPNKCGKADKRTIRDLKAAESANYQLTEIFRYKNLNNV